MSEENDKKRSTMDQVIMGAIIGTAIGSAIGMGLAPKKGSETRTGLFKVAGKLLKKIFGKSKPPSENMKALPDEMEILPLSGPKGSASNKS